MPAKQFGLCKLCGTECELTYEHVPPKSANNKSRYFSYSLDSLSSDPFLENTNGKPKQGGIGYYSLCKSCNNKTGGWYGQAYTEFANQAIYRLRLADAQYVNGDPYIIHPFKIIKQVISFFVSIGTINYSEHYPALAKFVLDKDNHNLPSDFQLFMYYNDSSNYRYMADNFVLENGIMQNYSEIAHFPFGFILSFKRTGVAIDERLTDITSWKNYPFKNKEIRLSIPLKKLPVEVAGYPGDYRNRDEIDRAVKKSIETYGKQ